MLSSSRRERLGKEVNAGPDVERHRISDKRRRDMCEGRDWMKVVDNYLAMRSRGHLLYSGRHCVCGLEADVIWGMALHQSSRWLLFGCKSWIFICCSITVPDMATMFHCESQLSFAEC